MKARWRWTRRISMVLAVGLSAGLLWAAEGAEPAAGTGEKKAEPKAAAAPFEPTWESLKEHAAAQWFRDAKFGIYTHWGPYAVPAFGSEWYPRNMYRKGSRENKHHEETYGPPSKFGYKDFVPKFTAGKFNADEWAELFKQAGAKFAGPVAEHHDGFSMWDSDVNRWNAADMGPKRDVVGELAKAVRKRGLKFVATLHHAHNILGYFPKDKACDTGDPKHRDLYGNYEKPEEGFKVWLAKTKEVIDKYQPDELWFDSWLDKIPEKYRLEMVAHYYNQARRWGKEVVLTHKQRDLPKGVAVLDIERGRMQKPTPDPWQTDDSVAANTWGYTTDMKLKTVQELVQELADIVSKNGVLLLNVAPKADGTIPDDQKKLLLGIGKWLKVNGESIYGTEVAPVAKLPWGCCTAKPGKLYLHVFDWPAGDLEVPGIQVSVADAYMLADPDRMSLLIGKTDEGVMTVSVPRKAPDPCDSVIVLKLAGAARKAAVGKPTAQAADGTIALKAVAAAVHGRGARYESGGGKDNIGFWTNAQDWVSWQLDLTKPGTFEVTITFACAKGSGGSAYTLAVGKQQLQGKIKETGSWTDFVTEKLGTLTLDKPGRHTLSVKPVSKPGTAVMNLQAVTLKPVKK